jgi:hypothetical protein
MNRLQKFIERTADGRELRTAYAMAVTALPDPRPRAKWSEDTSFSAVDEVLAKPELRPLFKAAIDRGFAIVPENRLKAKPDE